MRTLVAYLACLVLTVTRQMRLNARSVPTAITPRAMRNLYARTALRELTATPLPATDLAQFVRLEHLLQVLKWITANHARRARSPLRPEPHVCRAPMGPTSLLLVPLSVLTASLDSTATLLPVTPNATRARLALRLPVDAATARSAMPESLRLLQEGAHAITAMSEPTCHLAAITLSVNPAQLVDIRLSLARPTAWIARLVASLA
jgi:hypothetical protein